MLRYYPLVHAIVKLYRFMTGQGLMSVL